MSDPAQPSRFEKKKNTYYCCASAGVAFDSTSAMALRTRSGSFERSSSGWPIDWGSSRGGEETSLDQLAAAVWSRSSALNSLFAVIWRGYPKAMARNGTALDAISA